MTQENNEKIVTQEWYERMRGQDFDDYEEMMDLEDLFNKLIEEGDVLHGNSESSYSFYSN